LLCHLLGKLFGEGNDRLVLQSRLSTCLSSRMCPWLARQNATVNPLSLLPTRIYRSRKCAPRTKSHLDWRCLQFPVYWTLREIHAHTQKRQETIIAAF
jgi:hypothetical protein